MNGAGTIRGGGRDEAENAGGFWGGYPGPQDRAGNETGRPGTHDWRRTGVGCGTGEGETWSASGAGAASHECPGAFDERQARRTAGCRPREEQAIRQTKGKAAKADQYRRTARWLAEQEAMSGTPELVALVENREMGRVQRDRNGRLSFTYDDRWRTAEDSFPLSLSMPLALAEHGHSKIDAYLWGLLPDNEQVLAKWGRKFHVSARNAFGLIANVGEDSPGAVQFVQPERVEALRRATPADVNWLTEAMIAERLRALRADHGAWRLPRDTGQFSLAGAQPKTALFFLNRRWGLPSGRVPTTHILKPPTGEFDGHVENEHFCLELA